MNVFEKSWLFMNVILKYPSNKMERDMFTFCATFFVMEKII